MTTWIAQKGLWLLFQASTLPDTVVMKPVPGESSWFETVSGIASVFISIALLALAVGLLPAAWNLRKSHKKVNDLLDRVYGDVTPIVRHVHTIADNVDYITTSVRVDVQQINETIAAANQRLNDAVRLTERRMAEFNALMDVVQREAEGAFVTTASTIRGVRAGASMLQDEVTAELNAPLSRGVDALNELDLEEIDDDGDNEGRRFPPDGGQEAPRHGKRTGPRRTPRQFG